MKCKYCHQPAGWFSNKHKECEQKHYDSIKEMKEIVGGYLSKSSPISYNGLRNELLELASRSFVEASNLDGIIKEALSTFLQNKDVNIDGEALKYFIFSFPKELKKQITALNCYKDFWALFFKHKLSSTKTTTADMGMYQTLITEVKSDDEISLAIDKSLLSILESKIMDCLSDGIIEDYEEEQLSNFIQQSTLSSKVIHESSVYQKLVQALVLRDIQEGKIVDRFNVTNLPLLLGKKEQVLWVFTGVTGYEEKTGRRYIGGSRGVSLRICKGVYYRIGASKGHSVDYQYQNELGQGIFVVTNKNLYFLGAKQVKMAISKVLSFEPYSNGIVLVKDGANPKPYTFMGFDSWFVVNVMQLLVE